MGNAAVLVLNQNYEPLNVCNARRAFVLVDRGKAEVLEHADGGVLRSTDGGATWQRVGTGVWGYALTAHPTDRRTLFVADPWGVRKVNLPALP